MDYGIFNVRIAINACDCERGCTDTVTESAQKVDSGRKNPLPHRGIEPASAACRSDALPTESDLTFTGNFIKIKIKLTGLLAI